MGLMESGAFWFGIGALLLFLGLVTPGGIMFFFALGAFFAGVMSWLYDVSVGVQLLSFVFISGIGLLSYHSQKAARAKMAKRE